MWLVVLNPAGERLRDWCGHAVPPERAGKQRAVHGAGVRGARGGRDRAGGRIQSSRRGADPAPRLPSPLPRHGGHHCYHSPGPPVQPAGLDRPAVGSHHPVRLHPVRPGDRHGDPATDILGHRQLLVNRPLQSE